MPDLRKNQLAEWAAKKLQIDTPEMSSVSGDASFRRYFRFCYQQQSIIAVDAPPAYEDSTAFVRVARVLREQQLNVPQIYHIDQQLGFILLSDLGDQLYLPFLSDESVDQLYQKALHALHKIQAVDVNALTNFSAYDEQPLVEEMQLFKRWFIKKHLQISLTNEEQQLVETVFSRLVENALAQPQVLVHRDYHSRNLMICDDATPGIIDFQDAVIGPVSYDLVSLLKDCYIVWPSLQVKQWCFEFYQRSLKIDKRQIDFERFYKQFELMGIQRHLKVLGIFCRLNYRDGKSDYLSDLAVTYNYLIEAVARYPELDGFHGFLKNRVEPLI